MLDDVLTELLDLTVTEKGYGNALYASNDDGGGCSGGGCCCSLGCFELCISLCW